uniref:Uncharacterized protein n=1 Tax=Anguilla anguilla TaxID=7936 RepID=A0A0E9S1E3_ANGAN
MGGLKKTQQTDLKRPQQVSYISELLHSPIKGYSKYTA